MSLELRLVVSMAPAALVPTAPARVVSAWAAVRLESLATVALFPVVPAEFVAPAVVERAASDESGWAEVRGVVVLEATVVLPVSRSLSAPMVERVLDDPGVAVAAVPRSFLFSAIVSLVLVFVVDPVDATVPVVVDAPCVRFSFAVFVGLVELLGVVLA